MRKTNSCDILFLDLALSAEPPVAPVYTLTWVIKHIRALYEANQTAWWTHNKKLKIRIGEMSPIDSATNSVTLLLHYNDVNAPDAAFCHIETDEHREATKADLEGRPKTAHLVLSLDDLTPDPNRYLAYLEMIPELPRAVVQRYINWLLQQIKKSEPASFAVPHPDGSKDKGTAKKLKFRLLVGLDGHLSEDFHSELKTGKLRGISLITKNTEEYVTGNTPHLKVSTSELKLQATTSFSENPWAKIQEALNLGKLKGYEDAKITFQSEDETPHTCYLDTNTARIRNDGFVKRQRIEDKIFAFKEAETKINEPLQAYILKILAAEKTRLTLEFENALRASETDSVSDNQG